MELDERKLAAQSRGWRISSYEAKGRPPIPQNPETGHLHDQHAWEETGELHIAERGGRKPRLDADSLERLLDQIDARERFEASRNLV